MLDAGQQTQDLEVTLQSENEPTQDALHQTLELEPGTKVKPELLFKSFIVNTRPQNTSSRSSDPKA